MRPIDIMGQKFGRLTAVSRSGSKKGEGVLWRCKCDCGNEAIVTYKKLKSGNTKSCGCINRDALVARNKAAAKHGMTKTPEFITWDSMLQRCYNPNHKSFAEYGGRGIVVCDEWRESFSNFFRDMGVRPKNMTLDREDVNGHYEPGNCRWVSMRAQSNNRRNNRHIEIDGVIKTVAEWAREAGISRHCLMYRLNNGWGAKEAVTMKVNHGNGWARGVRA